MCFPPTSMQDVGYCTWGFGMNPSCRPHPNHSCLFIHLLGQLSVACCALWKTPRCRRKMAKTRMPRRNERKQGEGPPGPARAPGRRGAGLPAAPEHLGDGERAAARTAAEPLRRRQGAGLGVAAAAALPECGGPGAGARGSESPPWARHSGRGAQQRQLLWQGPGNPMQLPGLWSGADRTLRGPAGECRAPRPRLRLLMRPLRPATRPGSAPAAAWVSFAPNLGIMEEGAILG